MSSVSRFIMALGLSVMCARTAQAHAFLDSAEPAVGSTVKTSPAAVKIWFTRQLANVGSNIQVSDAKGKEVDAKDARIDPGDKFLMTVSLLKLAAGEYTVTWNAVCTDSHHTTGTYTFTVVN